MAFILSRFNTHRDIKYSQFTWKQISIIPPSISCEKCFGSPLKHTTSGGDAALQKAPMCSCNWPWPSSPCSPKPHLPTCIWRQGPGNRDHVHNLCWSDTATRCPSFFTQMEGRQVFTWQNKVPHTAGSCGSAVVQGLMAPQTQTFFQRE